MNKKYCLIPDEEKFYSFLASLTFSPVELMQLKLMHINQICVDESACQCRPSYRRLDSEGGAAACSRFFFAKRRYDLRRRWLQMPDDAA